MAVSRRDRGRRRRVGLGSDPARGPCVRRFRHRRCDPQRRAHRNRRPSADRLPRAPGSRIGRSARTRGLHQIDPPQNPGHRLGDGPLRSHRLRRREWRPKPHSLVHHRRAPRRIRRTGGSRHVDQRQHAGLRHPPSRQQPESPTSFLEYPVPGASPARQRTSVHRDPHRCGQREPGGGDRRVSRRCTGGPRHRRHRPTAHGLRVPRPGHPTPGHGDGPVRQLPRREGGLGPG